MNQSDSIPVTAYLGLGSNLAEPVTQIKSARLAIANLLGVREISFSSLYQSVPMGPQDQPDYINAVMGITTELAPHALLQALQAIETGQGRIRRGERWGARTLDLDILIYGDQMLDFPDLTVPHPGLAERAFVLYPLSEIAPDIIIPGKGAISGLLAKCPFSGLKRLN
ncbi:MAG: 2-amino-4-hydroxy-6-hydroxymethyldihydropteridine diphosphokinase [Methylococcales bacterium]|nr:2-amino-4-hydroxy-6-hydroxymethyldihydropteridine diphosphokinase [Methylococcales bacterium]